MPECHQTFPSVVQRLHQRDTDAAERHLKHQLHDSGLGRSLSSDPMESEIETSGVMDAHGLHSVF